MSYDSTFDFYTFKFYEKYFASEYEKKFRVVKNRLVYSICIFTHL